MWIILQENASNMKDLFSQPIRLYFICIAAFLLAPSCTRTLQLDGEPHGDVFTIDEYYIRLWDKNGDAYYTKTNLDFHRLVFSKGLEEGAEGQVWKTDMKGELGNIPGEYTVSGNKLKIDAFSGDLCYISKTWTMKKQTDGSILLVNEFYTNRTEETTEKIRISFWYHKDVDSETFR